MLDKFLEYLLLEKRYSPHTIINYRKDLEDFSHFHLETEAQNNIIAVEKIHVRNFVSHCGEKNLSKRTINRKLSSLRGFYLFLLKIGEIEQSPVESIKSLKMFAEKQIPYSEDEMQQLQNLYKSLDISLLDKLILEMLYQTGMRKAELANLLVKNVVSDTFYIKIVGKGNKERVVPISSELNLLIKNYVKERNPLVENKTYLLINKKGKKINEKYIYRVVNKYLKLVTSKKKKIHIHCDIVLQHIS